MKLYANRTYTTKCLFTLRIFPASSQPPEYCDVGNKTLDWKIWTILYSNIHEQRLVRLPPFRSKTRSNFANIIWFSAPSIPIFYRASGPIESQ